MMPDIKLDNIIRDQITVSRMKSWIHVAKSTKVLQKTLFLGTKVKNEKAQ